MLHSQISQNCCGGCPAAREVSERVCVDIQHGHVRIDNWIQREGGGLGERNRGAGRQVALEEELSPPAMNLSINE
jgi:hypothetical protein